MYEIAICDDDSVFAQELSSVLAHWFAERGAACHVTVYPYPARTLSALERGERCDLLFQDILLGEEKGLSFAKRRPFSSSARRRASASRSSCGSETGTWIWCS